MVTSGPDLRPLLFWSSKWRCVVRSYANLNVQRLFAPYCSDPLGQSINPRILAAPAVFMLAHCGIRLFLATRDCVPSSTRLQRAVAEYAMEAALSLVGTDFAAALCPSPVSSTEMGLAAEAKPRPEEERALEMEVEGEEVDTALQMQEEAHNSLLSLAQAIQVGRRAPVTFSTRPSLLRARRKAVTALIPTASAVEDSSPVSPSAAAEVDKVPGKEESALGLFVRTRLHLITRLSMGMPQLLTPICELYGIVHRYADSAYPTPDFMATSSVDPSPGATTASTSISAEKDNAKESPLDETALQSKPVYTVVQEVVKAELFHTILPALRQMYPAAELFSCIAKCRVLPKSALVEALDTLLPNFNLPPELDLVARVKGYVESAVGAGEGPNQSIATKLLACIIGGLSAEEIVSLLPKLLLECLASGDSVETDTLRKTLHRVVQARPPPLSPTALLVALHRYVIDLKNYLLNRPFLGFP